MAPKGNNMIPNVHFHKDWQRYIKCWFNQPGRKVRRHRNRVMKARKIAPRPIGLLRPIVQCSTIRYNTRARLGKGFTIQELKSAGVIVKQAPTIGISVDYKRRNYSADHLQRNVERLKEYKSKLILFPRNKKKPTKMDSTKEECSKAEQLKGKIIMPYKKPSHKFEARPITKVEKRRNVFVTLRKERQHMMTWGKKAKEAKEAAEDAALLMPKK